MADVYIWSGATGAGTGADWTNAFVNLTSISGKAAGDRFFVAHDHVQTQASALTITSPGTEATPCRIYCVNRAGSVPPVAADLRTTASVATTGAFSMSIAGTLTDIYGINFSVGDAANAAQFNMNNSSTRAFKFTSCTLKLNTTSTSPRIYLNSGAGSNITVLDNTTVQFGNVSQTMVVQAGRVVWRNTPNAVVGAIQPTTLMTWSGGGTWFCEGVDFSGMAAGKNLFAIAANGALMNGYLKDCKLGASGIMVNPTNGFGGHEVVTVRCDAGDVNYRSDKINWAGAQTTETAIVLTGGASDGSQPISWKITTTANPEPEFPFESLPITIWNDTVGASKTLTLQGIWGTAALPKNDDIWIDVQYLGTSGVPLASKASSRPLPLVGNADLAAGSGTWGGSTTKFAMSVTFTPQKKGFVTVYVNVAKVSSVFYVDPKPVIS